MEPSTLATVAPFAAFPITPTAPAMLGGLALASLPIVIHLLHRRRFKTVDWAAMEWLLEAIRKRSRLLNLEQLILLAVRTLLVICVVLAMAKPVLNAAQAAGLAPNFDRGAVHTVVVFDNSLSMQYSAGNRTSFDKAKRAAQQALEASGPGDFASVVALGSPPTVLVREPSNNVQEVVKEIDGLKPHHGAGRIEPALDAIAAILKQSRAARQRVLFVTDMQRSAWSPGPNASAQNDGGDFAKRLQALAETGREFVVYDVGEPDAGNSAVVRLEQLQATALAKQNVLFRATLAHFGDQPRGEALVEFLVDGQVEASERVTLPAGGKETSVAFHHTFRDAGEKYVEVRLPDDSLKIDDRRGLGVAVRDAVRVLLIDGQPSGEPFRSETDYLRIALAPDDDSPISVAVRFESDLLETKLDDWDAVLLCNVGNVTPAEATQLRDYLKRGGSVGFILGSQVNVEAYNQLLYAGGKGVLPIELDRIVGDPAKTDRAFLFDSLGYKHPTVAAFGGHENTGLVTAKTYAYFRVKPPKPTDAGGRRVETALAFVGGDPALTFANVERGRTAVVTTGADLDWNRWPISPSYLPVMQNVVRDLAAARFRRPSAVVGEPTVVVLPRSGFDVPTKLISPGGAETKLAVDESSGVATTTVADLDSVGAYKLDFGSPINLTWPLAANAPTVESNLARIAVAELQSEFPGLPISVVKDWSDRPRSSADTRAVDAGLHRPFLWLALLLALVETALAWRCGHHS
jgi:hypothetical protein